MFIYEFGLFHCILITRTTRKFKKHVNKYLLEKGHMFVVRGEILIYRLYSFVLMYRGHE
jgi:hypothetical protein